MKKPAWAIAAILIGLVPLSVQSQPTAGIKWHWVWVKPTRNGWTAFEGDAPVSRTGSRFEVTLDGVSAAEQPSLKLDGTIVGARVSATGTQLGTDAYPEHYTGSIERARTKLTDPSNGWGFDRITLRAGTTFVGLYRDVKSTH
jgi:hypothetical protein